MYRCQVALFTTAKPNNRFSSVIDPIRLNIEKIPIKEYYIKAKGQLLVGIINDRIGNIYNAEEFNKIIINNFPLHKDSNVIQRALTQSGIFHIKTRGYSNAVSILRKAILISKLLKDSIYQAKNLENLGIAYLWAGDYVKARSSLTTSIQLAPDPSGAIETEIARSYLFEGIYDEALKQGLIALKKSNADKNIQTQFQSLSLLGNVYLKKKNYIQANAYFNKALALRTAIEDKREIVKTLLPLAQTKLAANQADQALAFLDEAINILGYDRKIVDGKTLPSEMLLIELFAEKANCYLAKAKASPSGQYLEDAEKNFDKSIEVLTDMRHYHDNPGTIEEISKGAKAIFEASVATSLKLYDGSKNKKYLDKAFLTIQKYGSFNLRKNISERKALDLAVSDEATRNRFLKAKVDFLNEEYKLNAEFTEEGFAAYNLAKNKFQQIRDSLEKHNKKFSKLSQKINYITIKDVQSKLKTDEVFLQYFIANSSITTLSIYKNEVSYHTVANDSIFKNNVQHYLSILSHPNTLQKKMSIDSVQQLYAYTSHYLYNTLIGPSVSKKPIAKIIAVPDGPLFRIPFESFTIKPDATHNEASSYLLSKYTVDYLYYPAQYLRDELQEYEDYFIGIGLEYDNYTLESMKDFKHDTTLLWIKDKFRSESLSHLYFADDEVKEVAKHFGGKAYVNDDATKQNLMKSIHDAGILHISAHSCVDFTDPQKSAIILHKKDSITDNLIKYEDISECDLNSQMVILSACSSASGKISEAEGVSSLSKAFFEAGSQSVVGSYWSVPDEVSKLFMEAFYKKLKEGKPKDVALREVKLEFISNNSFVSPFYQRPQFWAAWTLYGDVQPLKVNSYLWAWLLGGLALVTLAFFTYKLTKKSTV